MRQAFVFLAVLFLFTEPEKWMLNTMSNRASEIVKNPPDVHATLYDLSLTFIFVRLSTLSKAFQKAFKIGSRLVKRASK